MDSLDYILRTDGSLSFSPAVSPSPLIWKQLKLVRACRDGGVRGRDVPLDQFFISFHNKSPLSAVVNEPRVGFWKRQALFYPKRFGYRVIQREGSRDRDRLCNCHCMSDGLVRYSIWTNFRQTQVRFNIKTSFLSTHYSL